VKDKLYIIKTDIEHGLTDSRIVRCVSDALNISSDDSRLIVNRTAAGKPVLPYVNVHVSVSHSGGYWVCIVSEKCVGLDIQKSQKCSQEKIINRYFHDDEKNWLQVHPDEFFLVWSVKESYVKYCGDGLSMGMDSFSAISKDEIADKINGVDVRVFKLKDDIFGCVCGGCDVMEMIEFLD